MLINAQLLTVMYAMLPIILNAPQQLTVANQDFSLILEHAKLVLLIAKHAPPHQIVVYV